jgi:hypothetical protein
VLWPSNLSLVRGGLCLSGPTQSKEATLEAKVATLQATIEESTSVVREGKGAEVSHLQVSRLHFPWCVLALFGADGGGRGKTLSRM